MPWLNITCGKCGHDADIGEFTSTPVCGPLPRDHYQCPRCGYAFRRVSVGQPRLCASGFVLPPPVMIVEVASRL